MKEVFCNSDWKPSWYVDHQSQISFPVDSASGVFSRDFADDLFEFFMRDDVIVLGGNDNNSPPADFLPHYEHEFDMYQLKDAGYHNQLRALKSGDFWTIYNPNTGAKIRFSFIKDAVEPVRSDVPELVDMKITNYCPFQCPFCYQDSGSSGKHADYDDIESYLVRLSHMGTFEVAIGGGEPLHHPDIINILYKAKSLGITPNITTRLMPDMWEESLIHAMNDTVGGVAVSVESTKQVDKIHDVRSNLGFNINLSANFVIGPSPQTILNDVLNACAQHYIPITLLGFKRVGRGKPFNCFKHTIGPDTLMVGCKVSADTAFCEEFKDELEIAGINGLMIAPGEGRHSMYIDAVEGTAGISSYHTNTFVECPPLSNLKKIWEGFKI